MKKIIATGLISSLLTFAAAAADDDAWIKSAGNKNAVYEIKRGSFEVLINKAGEEVAVVIGRSQTGPESARNISLEKWYVRTMDCRRGQGKLVTLSLGGDFLFENDFLFEGGSIASANAELICAIHATRKENERKRGL